MSTDVSPRPDGMAAPANSTDPLLVVEELTVKFPTHDGLVQAVTDLSYSVDRGKTLGIVGESGSGKSVSSMAVLGLHDPKHSRLSGSIRIDGQEVIGASEDRMRKIRGNSVAMIFQDALTALHPFYTIGDQISEGYRIHHQVSKSRRQEARHRDARPRRHPPGRTAGSTTIRTSSRVACGSAR